MKTYNEIKDILINKYGIIDQNSYKEFTSKRFKDGITQEEVDLLSPDNVNNNDFWQFINEFYGIDPVCQTNYAQFKVGNKMVANRRNLGICRLDGTLNVIDHNKYCGCTFLEIGAGFGCIKNYVEVNTNLDYAGVDVYPQIHDVIKSNPDGSLPDSILKLPVTSNYFGIVFSTNVFQHLSVNQRKKYYQQIRSIIHEQGIFAFNTTIYSEPRNVDGVAFYKCKDSNKAYIGHYAQYTEVLSFQEEVNNIIEWFDISSYNISKMNTVSFILSPKSFKTITCTPQK